MKLLKIRFKNFFSSGNSFIEIDLVKSKKTIFHGKNGFGKSTVPNAITFALFDKIIKKVTRGLIVNSINGKNCLVEIELENDGSSYLIRRGIKPNIFEIYKDGNLIDQTSVSDYQEYLETTILRCSYRTFIQTSIISIENYTPFMSLPKQSRREFIEDILDIRVFSVMNQLLKSTVSKNKDRIKLLELNIKNIKDKLVMQKLHIEKLVAIQTSGTDAIDRKIEELLKEKSTLELTLVDRDDRQKNFEDRKTVLTGLVSQLAALNRDTTLISGDLRGVNKDLLFFEKNVFCPTCKRDIEEEYSGPVKCKHTNTKNDLELKLQELQEKIDGLGQVDVKMYELQREETQYNSLISTTLAGITRCSNSIKNLENEKLAVVKTSNLSDQKESMRQMAKEAMDYKNELTGLLEEQEYNTMMLELLKDSGIKSKIIDQYIPVINTLVNQYLERMDFFVSFHLDSEFNETVKSRHRDTFTYGSFSAGEKQRIDIALMFTFSQLAKMRNSFSSNLLLLDEIGDASIDADGINLMIDIFGGKEFDHTNIFVISHSNKDKFESEFDQSIEFYKRDGFTQIK